MTNETPAAFLTDNYEIAEAVAPSWERRRTTSRAFARLSVAGWSRSFGRARGHGPGAGRGVGETGFQAAPILGERGRWITTDFSPTILDAARRRAAELGVTNVSTRSWTRNDHLSRPIRLTVSSAGSDTC